MVECLKKLGRCPLGDIQCQIGFINKKRAVLAKHCHPDGRPDQK
jgi:hypothetical protein